MAFSMRQRFKPQIQEIGIRRAVFFGQGSRVGHVLPHAEFEVVEADFGH